MRFITSERLERFERKMPFIAEVTQMLPGLRTPRIVMHEWRRFDDDGNALHVQFFDQQIRDFFGHPLLHLRPVRNAFDHAGQLAEPDDVAIGNVADVGHAAKRQQVVLAHAVEADIADEHHLIVFLGEEFSQVEPRVVVQAAEKLGVHAGDAGRRFAETFAIRVFADGGEDFAHGPLDPGQIDLRAAGGAVAVG